MIKQSVLFCLTYFLIEMVDFLVKVVDFSLKWEISDYFLKIFSQTTDFYTTLYLGFFREEICQPQMETQSVTNG